MPLSPPGSPNYDAGRDGEAVRWIVLHTMDGDVAGATARFNNTGVPLADRVSAHYGVASTGGIVRWVAEQDTAWHAGNYQINLESIGIEHEDHGDYNGARPDALYATSAALVRDICIRYGLPIDRNTIRLHREIVATGCPDALDVDRIVRLAQQGDPVTNPINNKAIATFAARQAYVDIRGEPSVDELIAKRDGVDADLGNLDTMLATTLDSPEGSAYRADGAGEINDTKSVDLVPHAT